MLGKGSVRRPENTAAIAANWPFDMQAVVSGVDYAGRWPDYAVTLNRHGVLVKAGPRSSGPHARVWDHWDTKPDDKRLPGPATVRCSDCRAEWPEGGEYPTKCT